MRYSKETYKAWIVRKLADILSDHDDLTKEERAALNYIIGYLIGIGWSEQAGRKNKFSKKYLVDRQNMFYDKVAKGIGLFRNSTEQLRSVLFVAFNQGIK